MTVRPGLNQSLPDGGLVQLEACVETRPLAVVPPQTVHELA